MATQRGLNPDQKGMSSSVYVDQASTWANALTKEECEEPGDFDGAMRRVSGRIGVGYHTLWTLRYRHPKRIFADIYFKLQQAHDAMCQRQLEAIAREVEQRKAAGDRSPALDAAEALLRSLEA